MKLKLEKRSALKFPVELSNPDKSGLGITPGSLRRGETIATK